MTYPSKDEPKQLESDTISPEKTVSPPEVKAVVIELRGNRLEFMNVWLDEPAKQYTEIEENTSLFRFPVLTRRMPISLIRKITAQSLISKTRAMITMHPIPADQAESLANMISLKVAYTIGLDGHRLLPPQLMYSVRRYVP